MALLFLDWLYTGRETLIVVPRMLDRWNVVCLVVSGWNYYKVIIVTDYPSYPKSFSVLRSSDSEAIRKALSNSEVDIMLFDDICTLASLPSSLELSSAEPKIIALTTWGDSIEQINRATSRLRETRSLLLDIFSSPASIDWRVTRIPTPVKYLRCYNKPSEECGDEDPKLLSVLDNVTCNWPAKQIILTNSNLVSSFLQLMAWNSKSPYESREIVHVSSGDDYEASSVKLRKFKDLASGILVTNIVPSISLGNASVVHAVDGYSFSTVRGTIECICGVSTLVVYFHLATNLTTKTPDEILYEGLEININAADRAYSALISLSGRLSFDRNFDFIV